MDDATHSRVDGTTRFDMSADPSAPDGYELLAEVGRGGMGVVHRARDLALSREVAVKVLQGRFDPQSATAARFVEEARITGQLQHPGIPAVYRVGTMPDGRPYLAMKLIKGETLDGLLKSGVPLDRLGVFEAIAQAVGYAHAHGVIHRDLKPANVMVGAFGEVQVMDWGLAKVLGSRPGERPAADADATLDPIMIRPGRDSDTPFTQFGSALGTPAYMPPEQAAGETDKVGPRSDVFGLGGILCVLLTGKPPFVGGDAESVRLNAVRGKTGDALARLDASGADPEVIALCKLCLAVEPGDRPVTANVVAAAAAGLRRAAEDRARQAERDKLAADVRAAEQVKRRRTLARAGAGLALVLLLGIAGTTWGLVSATRARGRAEENESKAAAAAAAEQQAAERANRKLDEFVTLSNVLVTTFKNINPTLAQKGESLSDLLARRMADLGPVIEGVAADDPATAAEMQMAVGHTLVRLGRPRDAAATFRLAHKNRVAAFGPDDLKTWTCLNNLAVALNADGRRTDALPLFEGVYRRRTELLGPDHGFTLHALHNLAIQHYDMGRYPQALALAEECLARRRRSIEAHGAGRAEDPDDDPKVEWRDVLQSWNLTGTVYRMVGRNEEAQAAYSACLAAAADHFGADHETTRRYANNLVVAYLDADRPEVALPVIARVEEETRTAFDPDHPARLMALSNIGLTNQYLGRPDRAAAAFGEAYRRRKAALPADHPSLIYSTREYGNALRELGRFAEAEPLLAEAARLAAAKEGLGQNEKLDTRAALADLWSDTGRPAEAVAEYEAIVAGWLAKDGPDDKDTWRARLGLAAAQRRAGKASEAVAQLEDVLPRFRKADGPVHRLTLLAAFELAAAYAASGHVPEAAAVLEEPEKHCREKFGPKHRHTARVGAELGRRRLADGRFADAEPLLRTALDFYADVQPDLWRTYELKSILGAALAGQGKTGEAEPLLKAGAEGLAKHAAEIPVDMKGVVAEAARLAGSPTRPEVAPLPRPAS